MLPELNMSRSEPRFMGGAGPSSNLTRPGGGAGDIGSEKIAATRSQPSFKYAHIQPKVNTRDKLPVLADRNQYTVVVSTSGRVLHQPKTASILRKSTDTALSEVKRYRSCFARFVPESK